MSRLEAQRVLIYRVCGSGKTTFARRLSERSGLPWVSVDDMAWLPGWMTSSDEYQVQQIQKIIAEDAWILDTAYGKWIDLPLARVDLIVALDYPRWFSLARLVRRTFQRIADQKPICNGNRESWRTALSKDSIILWHFRSWRRKRERIRSWEGDPNKRVITFRHAREAEEWLASIESRANL